MGENSVDVCEKIIFRTDSVKGELDEVFVRDAFVHIERKGETEFWIGVDSPSGNLLINTGVNADGVWFFNVEKDELGGEFFSVKKGD